MFYSVFYNYIGLDKFFTTGEKGIQKNCIIQNKEDNNPEQATLPGPADQQLEDINSTGFCFSNKKSGYFEAYKIIYKKQVPNDRLYKRIFPSSTNLLLMPKSLILDIALTSFLRLQIGRITSPIPCNNLYTNCFSDYTSIITVIIFLLTI